MKIKRIRLIKSAKDLCEVLELEEEGGGPAIDTSRNVKNNELKEKIKQAGSFIETETEYQDLLPDTRNVLNDMKIIPDFIREPEMDSWMEEEGKNETIKDKETEETEEKEDETDKTNISDESELSEETETVKPEEAPAETTIEKPDKKPDKKSSKDKKSSNKRTKIQKEAKEKERIERNRKNPDDDKEEIIKPKMKRHDAVIKAIKDLGYSGFTIPSLVTESNNIHIENGGKESKSHPILNYNIVNGLIGFDVLVNKNGIYSFTEKYKEMFRG